MTQHANNRGKLLKTPDAAYRCLLPCKAHLPPRRPAPEGRRSSSSKLSATYRSSPVTVSADSRGTVPQASHTAERSYVCLWAWESRPQRKTSTRSGCHWAENRPGDPTTPECAALFPPTRSRQPTHAKLGYWSRKYPASIPRYTDLRMASPMRSRFPRPEACSTTSRGSRREHGPTHRGPAAEMWKQSYVLKPEWEHHSRFPRGYPYAGTPPLS